MCGYCLTPKFGDGQRERAAYDFATVRVAISAEHRIAAMVEVTTLEDPVPRFVPVMQDEYFRK